jgi:glucuronoarabinoxylan endo-1,4-beta-xylanase
MWTLGNYSRFIEPGALRIQASCEEKEILVSAFMDEANGQLTLVLLNTSEKDQIANFNFRDLNPGLLRPYLTSYREEHSLYPLDKFDAVHAFEIPARSALTFITSIP